MDNYSYGNSNEEKRTPWSRSHFFFPTSDGTLADGVLDTTGFVEKVAFRTANTASGESKVCDVTINAYIGDSRVRRYFGESFVRDDHRVRFRMTYWGFNAENIEKMGIKEGDIVQVMMHSMKAEEGTTESGRIYRIVEAKTADGLDLISRSKRKDTESGNAGYDAPPAPYDQQQVNAAPAYQTPPAAKQPPRQTAPQPQQTMNNGLVCADCGAPIEQNVANFSEKKFGRYLCRDCQKTAGQPASQQRVPAQAATARNGAAPQPAQGFVCASCGKPVDAKVADFSARKYGLCLCRDCQKTAGQSTSQQRAPAQTQPAQQGYVCADCGAPIEQNVANYSERKFGRYLCRNCQSNGGRPSAAPQQPARAGGYARIGDLDLFEELDGIDESNPFYN